MDLTSDQSKLVMAARYMCGEITSNTGRQNNKLFGWLRKRHAEAMRKINTGRKDSDETKKRKSDALKNKTKTKEHIQKVTDALRGRKANPGSSEKRTATRMKNGSYVVSKSSRELRRQNRAMQADIHNVKICMFGINYISIKEARETLKVGRTYIINRLKSDKFPDCYYL